MNNMTAKRMIMWALFSWLWYIDEIWISYILMEIPSMTWMVRIFRIKTWIWTFLFQSTLRTASSSMTKTLHILFPMNLESQKMLTYMIHILLSVNIHVSSLMGYISCNIRGIFITLHMQEFSSHWYLQLVLYICTNIFQRDAILQYVWDNNMHNFLCISEI